MAVERSTTMILDDLRFFNVFYFIICQAYQECERITGIFAKTFYLGTKFMSPVARKVHRVTALGL